MNSGPADMNPGRESVCTRSLGTQEGCGLRLSGRPLTGAGL